MKPPKPTGMTAFYIVWVGQFLSLLGTSMTQFALTIWAYEKTGQATALALVAFFYVTPLLLLSPLAGVVVDRSSRKLMMMVSDLGAGVSTIIVLVLYSMGILEVWHLYITAFIAGSTEVFQWPAYSASISTMLPKEQYGRAHGMISLAGDGSRIFAPVAAAALLGLLGLQTILLIDVFTFTFAIGALLLVHIPQPKVSAEGAASKGSMLSESLFGFRYIWQRKGLLGLQMVFMVGNFFATWAGTLIAPMLLARTMNDELTLGSVQSMGAIGGVLGGLLMSLWGGPKRLVYGVFLGWAWSGMVGAMLMGFGQSWWWWAAASFGGALVIPILNGSNQAIWQRKVPADLQGRVFSIRRLVAWFVMPIATLSVGPLADFVMEPAMQEGGALVGMFGWLVGSGPGAGMALIIMFAGLMATLVGLGAFLLPVVRDVEENLPDHTQEVEVT
jgi:MFS transporter, DHA3 family, macrolide efflux protein